MQVLPATVSDPGLTMHSMEKDDGQLLTNGKSEDEDRVRARPRTPLKAAKRYVSKKAGKLLRQLRSLTPTSFK